MNFEAPSPDHVDVQLLERIAAGDRRAFEALFATYAKRIFRYAARMINDASKAEEVTNDVMVEVWKNAKNFECRSSVSTWIIGITRHRCLNAIRGRTLDTVEFSDAPEVRDDSADVEQVQDRATLCKLIRAQMRKLSPEHRDVLEQTFFLGFNYKEIAELAGCPENTVKTRMYHAKRQLAPLLRKLGLEAFLQESTP